MTDPDREIQRMHEAIEDWFTGRLADLAPFADALAPDFRLVSPDGETVDREAVVASMQQARGAHTGEQPSFAVEVHDLEHRTTADGHHLVTYEEHQRVDGAWEARTSTAWLREDPDAPGGFAWVHLHETWLD